jgi:hypothetical protein
MSKTRVLVLIYLVRVRGLAWKRYAYSSHLISQRPDVQMLDITLPGFGVARLWTWDHAYVLSSRSGRSRLHLSNKYMTAWPYHSSRLGLVHGATAGRI